MKSHILEVVVDVLNEGPRVSKFIEFQIQLDMTKKKRDKLKTQ